ncbi:uncharacterized protein LOC121271943 [Carcharodon carcharias]|uniref:uncharacterized protein LOC121271943 n=1 Tax=Carcharodon carcharias TaxID=13397 RepID=UPI001B7F5801|nr:uncharacterized protein LOC121271943 [Carcharodon carcharias]
MAQPTLLVTPLVFSIMKTFTLQLADNTSLEFKQLKMNIENQLNEPYRRIAPNGFQGYVVNQFRNGSIVVDGGITYKVGAVQLSGTEAVKVLVNELQNGTGLGGLQINRASIRSGDITENNLQPIDLKISFIIANRAFTEGLKKNTSVEFLSLKTSVISWLELVLKSGFDPNVLPGSTVMFSNDSTKVQVLARIQINTTRLEDRPLLRDLIFNNVSNSDCGIIKSSIQVNGEDFKADKFQLKLRFTNLAFESALSNRSSPQFEKLCTSITTVMRSIFASESNFTEIIINEFRTGSVVTDTAVVFREGATSSSSVIQKIVANEAAFRNANLTLDINSLINTTTITPTAPNPEATTTVNQPAPARPFPGYAIAIIVMCILAIIALLLLIVLFVKTGYCSKVANAFRLEAPDDLDMKFPMFGGRSYNFQW